MFVFCCLWQWSSAWINLTYYISHGKPFALERILTYNDKPLLLMKQLKEKKENPVFMLKHIKQMKSPAASAPSPPNSHPPRKSSDILNKELPLPPEAMSASSAIGGSSSNSLSPTGGGLTAHTNGHHSSLARSGTTASMRTSSKTAATTSTSSFLVPLELPLQLSGYQMLMFSQFFSMYY